MSRVKMGRRCLLIFLGTCFFFPTLRLGAAQTNKVVLKVSGHGFFGNRTLKKNLKLLDTEKNRSNYDANFIEDAALILVSRLKQEGYLRPEIVADLTDAEGQKRSFTWHDTIEDPLPRPLFARQLHFRVKRGVLYHYREIEFEGLSSLSRKEGLGFFIETGALLPMKKTRIFTPQKLQRGLSSLDEVLSRKGYQQAEVRVVQTNWNHSSGNVGLRIRVKEGPLSLVRTLQAQTFFETNREAGERFVVQTNVAYSRLWVQDIVQQLKNSNFHRGYPDTSVRVATSGKETRDAGTNKVVEMDIGAEITTGPQIHLGNVNFEGQKRTKESLMKRRARLKPGELLDRTDVEKGRNRLSRLGIFDSVDVEYQVADEHTRSVLFHLKEGKTIDVSLLAGYGSYELLRGGVEVEQYNIFGRAHHARLRAIQSFKATSADFTYTMPEFVGEDVDIFLNSSYLRRQEISFTRNEFGGGIGSRKTYERIDSDIGIQYKFEVLNALNTDVNIGPRTANVGSFIFDLKHDKRDHPLYPRSGYRITARLEVASTYLGGDVDYQRFEFAGSYHQPLDEGRWLHFGLSQGIVNPLNTALVDLPYNKRFFPGGENSVRGYDYGEAAPKNAGGQILGAEVFTVGNFEFEQEITSTWSLILFTDGIAFARDVAEFPGNEFLVSVGAGLRWKTVIGPVRLEYGYNVNPRPVDPTGTVQFSIGFPF